MYFSKILYIHQNDTGDNLTCKFGFKNNPVDITGKILIDGYDREVKDASKEGRYAGKQ